MDHLNDVVWFSYNFVSHRQQQITGTAGQPCPHCFCYNMHGVQRTWCHAILRGSLHFVNFQPELGIWLASQIPNQVENLWKALDRQKKKKEDRRQKKTEEEQKQSLKPEAWNQRKRTKKKKKNCLPHQVPGCDSKELKPKSWKMLLARALRAHGEGFFSFNS